MRINIRARLQVQERAMQVELPLPDNVIKDLTAKWGNLEQQILEIVVVQAYRDEVISAGKVRQILGMATRMEVEEFLKQKGIDLHYDETDLEADRQTHQQLRNQGKLPA